MNWGLVVGIFIPMMSGLLWIIYKFGSFEGKLDNLISRMDRFDIRLGDVERHLHKRHKKHK